MYMGDTMYILLLIASIVWGLNIVVTKVLLNFYSPLLLASAKLWISCFVLLILVIIYKQPIINKEGYKFQYLFFGVILNFLLTFIGSNITSANETAIINGFLPIVAYMLIHKFSIKQYNRYIVFAMLSSCTCYVLSTSNQGTLLALGNGMLFLSIISYSYGNILIQKHTIVNRFSYLLNIQIIAALFTTILYLLIEPSKDILHKEESILWIIAYIFTSGIGFAYIQITTLQAIKKIGTVLTNALLSLNPIFSYLFSYVFLSYEISSLTICCLFLLIATCFFTYRSNIIKHNINK